jgi:hypothetical protein
MYISFIASILLDPHNMQQFFIINSTVLSEDVLLRML